MFCMHTTYHLHLHLWNLLSACHSFPTFVYMQVIKINFFGLGNGVEKWARAKVQIISASFYFTWDLSALIFKLIYIYMFLNFLYVVGVQRLLLFQILLVLLKNIQLIIGIVVISSYITYNFIIYKVILYHKF